MSKPRTDTSLETAADWLAENRDAIEASNAWVEANGLPLRNHRLF